MNNSDSWKIFKEHVGKKIPSISDELFESTKSFYDLLTDFLNIVSFFERIDSEMSSTKSNFLMDIKNNLSRAAIYFYLNDDYLNSIILRGMIEEAYRLLIIYNFPEKKETVVYNYSRADMSKKIDRTLKSVSEQYDQLIGYQASVDKLYSDYSKALHGRGNARSERLYIVNNIGEENSFNNLMDDYRKILEFVCIVLSIRFKDTIIDTNNIIFLKKISNDFVSLMETLGNFNSKI